MPAFMGVGMRIDPWSSSNPAMNPNGCTINSM